MFKKIFGYSQNHEIEKAFGIRLPNRKISLFAGISLLTPAVFFLCALFTQRVVHQRISWLSDMFTWRMGVPLITFYFVIILFPIFAFMLNLRFFFSVWFDKDSKELKLSFNPGWSSLILAVAGFLVVVLFILHGMGDASAGQN